ncbi:MAG: chalcone isomerase [Flavobacteriaceae bacterium]|nr:MAG: chalcone isomerase [Flavobacteriaceae bacterium]
MKKSIAILAAVLLFAFQSVDAQTVTSNGVKVQSTLTVGSQKLDRIGSGVRKKYGMSMYVGTLYADKTKSKAALANANEPAAVSIHIVSSLITSERMEESIREGFVLSTGGNTKTIDARINQMIKVFSEPIKVGDVFDIKYSPTAGTQISKNGKLKVTIPGHDFKKALFNIWLGPKPVDAGLKKSMLAL